MKAQLMKSKVAVYSNYTRVTLEGGLKSVVDGYLGGFSTMFANKTTMRFRYAPYSVLIDLRTMKIIAAGDVSAQKAVSMCDSLSGE